MITTVDLEYRSATQLVAALGRREIGSRELLEHYLRRIEQHNPALNAVVTLDQDRARREATAADQAAARGESLGALHGLPMTVKDAIETAGMRTTGGIPDLAGHVPARDADAVARLRAAGAVIIGKTNVPVASSDFQTSNPIFGTTNNPWDLARSPGGSSGGSAVAVAAGLTGLDLAGDLAGSIRLPAHYCGVFGLKPSHCLVPHRGYIPGPPGTLAGSDIGVLGPIGRSADDLDLALGVLAGPGSAEAVAWRLELPAPRGRALADYRIAVWLDDPYCPVDAEVLDVLTDAVDDLHAAGAVLDERARPVELAAADALFRQLVDGVVCTGYPQPMFDEQVALAAHADPSDRSPLVRRARGVTQRKRDWNLVHEQRLRMASRWASFFGRFDVLLCPVAPTAAIPHDRGGGFDTRTITVDGRPRPYADQGVWPGLVGMAYLPAAVIPVGWTRDGLPVGLQIVAARFEDRTAIDVARHISRLFGGFEPPPGY